MNVVTVKINGLDYNLKGDESEGYILKVAEIVNDTIAKIRIKNKLLSANDVTSLASIRIADEFLKGLEEKELIQNQARGIFEKNAVLNEKVTEKDLIIQNLKEENMNLKERNENLSCDEHILDYEKEIASLKSQLEIIEEKRREYIKENSDLKLDNEKLLEENQDKVEMVNDLREKNNRANKKLIKMENELVDSNIALAKTLQAQSKRR